MKCPKCGFNSFDHLKTCKKCNGDLTENQARFSLRSFLPSQQSVETASAAAMPQQHPPSVARSPACLPDPPSSPIPEIATAPASGTSPAAEKDTAELSLEDLLGNIRSLAGEKFPAQPQKEQENSASAPTDTDLFRPITEEATEQVAARESSTTLQWPGDVDATAPPFVPPSAADSPSPPFASAGKEAAGSAGDLSFDLDDFDRIAPSGAFSLGPTSLGRGGGSYIPGLTGEFEFPAERLFAPGDQDAADAHETIAEAAPAAPLRKRFAAALTDTGLLGALFLLFIGAGEFALGGGRPLAQSLLDLAIPYFLVFFCLSFGYFTLFHFLVGQTVGKMLFRLRVTGTAEEPLRFSQAFLRSTGGLLSLLPAGTGFLLVPLDRDRRGWNDRLAGTRVVCCEAMALEEKGEEFSGANH
ncbi:MAG: RDD family protein [Desulfuromonadales bacterium]